VYYTVDRTPDSLVFNFSSQLLTAENDSRQTFMNGDIVPPSFRTSLYLMGHLLCTTSHIEKLRQKNLESTQCNSVLITHYKRYEFSGQ
jgi:hypothetical protein